MCVNPSGFLVNVSLPLFSFFFPPSLPSFSPPSSFVSLHLCLFFIPLFLTVFLSFFLYLASLTFSLSFASISVSPFSLPASLSAFLSILKLSLQILCLCTKWETAKASGISALHPSLEEDTEATPFVTQISQDFPLLIIWLCKYILIPPERRTGSHWLCVLDKQRPDVSFRL